MRLLLPSLLAACCSLAACSSPPPPAPAPPPPPPPQEAPPAPRCKASEANSPSDARQVMKAAGDDVKACFLLGKASSAPDSVAIDVKVGEDGSVASVSASASGAEKSQLGCAENAVKKQKFARFCGDPVVIGWKYNLAR